MPIPDDSLQPITEPSASDRASPPATRDGYQLARTAAVIVAALCLVVIAVAQVTLARYQAQGICAQRAIHERSGATQGSPAAQSTQRQISACFE